MFIILISPRSSVHCVRIICIERNHSKKIRSTLNTYRYQWGQSLHLNSIELARIMPWFILLAQYLFPHPSLQWYQGWDNVHKYVHGFKPTNFVRIVSINSSNNWLNYCKKQALDIIRYIIPLTKALVSLSKLLFSQNLGLIHHNE